MNVNLGKGFGPLDFDENGKMFSFFPEDLPYIDDGFDGDGADFTVYVDAELVEAVCNSGLDFDDFLRADEEERRAMLEDVGLNPNDFELDFDRDVRDRLEAEGYFDSEYDYDDLDDEEGSEDDDYDFEEDDDEDDDEDSDEFDEDDFEEGDYDENLDEEFDEGEDDDFDEDDFEDGFGDDSDQGDAFFGKLGH